MQNRRIVLLAIVVTMFLAGVAEAASGLPEAQLTAGLEDLQQTVRELRDVYPEAVDGGEVVDPSRYQKASALADRVRDAFGDTPLLQALHAKSTVLAELIKADAVYLNGLVADRKSVDEVVDHIDKMLPNLNRAVIVAKGKVFPVGMRMIGSAAEIQAAVEKVRQKVSEAVRVYEEGDRERAASLANDAFFLFEVTGLGPDATLLDEELENDVETAISSFGQGAADPPGLEQLMSGGAANHEVTEKAGVVRSGLGTLEELLVQTLPRKRVGDANGDGRVSIVDALYIAQASLGLRPVDAATADANGDGRVSIVDALFVAQAAAGLRKL